VNSTSLPLKRCSTFPVRLLLRVVLSLHLLLFGSLSNLPLFRYPRLGACGFSAPKTQAQQPDDLTAGRDWGKTNASCLAKHLHSSISLITTNILTTLCITKTTALRLILIPMAFPPAMPKTCNQGRLFFQ
jgi:hypothetical protein